MDYSIKGRLVLGVLLSMLAWLTMTRSGKNFAGKIGAKIMEFSDAGLEMLMSFEGFSPTPYPDPPGSGKYSIGFGHQIKPWESFEKITRKDAIELLRADTEHAKRVVSSTITVPLSQEQFDALVSFVYNIGENAFRVGTVPSKINAGNFTAAAETMRRYINSGGRVNFGLVARRNQEAAAFA